MIPMLAATLLIYLLAQFAGVNPTIPIAVGIIGEIAWTLIKRARTPRRPFRPSPRPARSVAYRPVTTQNVTTRAVTSNRKNQDFTTFTQLLNDQPDPGGISRPLYNEDTYYDRK